MTTGEIIQRERTRLGLSQEKLAEQVGVSHQAVSKWELGDAVPDTDKLVPLARTLGISVDTLLDHHPQKTEETPKEIEEKKPGWLALHWYWIGVPLSLWGCGPTDPNVVCRLVPADDVPGVLWYPVISAIPYPVPNSAGGRCADGDSGPAFCPAKIRPETLDTAPLEGSTGADRPAVVLVGSLSGRRRCAGGRTADVRFSSPL